MRWFLVGVGDSFRFVFRIVFLVLYREEEKDGGLKRVVVVFLRRGGRFVVVEG